jgi:hypothetical protein
MILDPNLWFAWVLIQLAFFVPVFYLVSTKKMGNLASLLASILMAAGTYWGIETLLSYPKPIEIQVGWLAPKEYRVIAFKVASGDALYLYLDTGEQTPRSYSMRWSPKTSRLVNELIRKSAKSRNEGGDIMYNPSVEESEGVSLRFPLPDMRKGDQ